MQKKIVKFIMSKEYKEDAIEYVKLLKELEDLDTKSKNLLQKLYKKHGKHEFDAAISYFITAGVMENLRND